MGGMALTPQPVFVRDVTLCVRLPSLAAAWAVLLVPHAAARDQGGFPPSNAGCTDAGSTRSATAPTVRLASSRLVLRPTGRVRMVLRGSQTAAATVTLKQRGGKLVGGTARGGYTCVVAGESTIGIDLNAYGRRLVARNGRLPMTATFRLTNGSDVKRTQVLVGTVRR